MYPHPMAESLSMSSGNSTMTSCPTTVTTAPRTGGSAHHPHPPKCRNYKKLVFLSNILLNINSKKNHVGSTNLTDMIVQ